MPNLSIPAPRCQMSLTDPYSPGCLPRLGFRAKARAGAFPSKRRSKPIRTERAGRAARGSAERASRRPARTLGAALFRGDAARWRDGTQGGTTGGPARHGASPGRSVNQSAEREALAAWRGTCPGVGAGSAAPEQSAGACDQAARQAEREATTEGRHYFAQRSVMYSGGTQWSAPPCGEGPPEGSPQIRRRCASPMLCDVIASRSRDPKGTSRPPL